MRRQEGVRFLWHVQPVEVVGEEQVKALELARLEAAEDGSLVPMAGSQILLEVDLVVLAIGQATHTEFLAAAMMRQGAAGAGTDCDRSGDGADVEPEVFCGWGLHEWRARGGGCGGGWEARGDWDCGVAAAGEDTEGQACQRLRLRLRGLSA